jgi:hypothetical protein
VRTDLLFFLRGDTLKKILHLSHLLSLLLMGKLSGRGTSLYTRDRAHWSGDLAWASMSVLLKFLKNDTHFNYQVCTHWHP